MRSGKVSALQLPTLGSLEPCLEVTVAGKAAGKKAREPGSAARLEPDAVSSEPEPAEEPRRRSSLRLVVHRLLLACVARFCARLAGSAHSMEGKQRLPLGRRSSRLPSMHRSKGGTGDQALKFSESPSPKTLNPVTLNITTLNPESRTPLHSRAARQQPREP